MPEQRDNWTQRILAIATLIGSMTPLVIYGLDKMQEGKPQVETFDTRENIEIQPVDQDSKEEPPVPDNPGTTLADRRKTMVPEMKSNNGQVANEDQLKGSGGVNGVNSDNRPPEEMMAREVKTFQLIREGYVLAEGRYLPFDENQLRLYPSEIDTKKRVVQIVIKDNNGTTITRGEIGESEDFEFDYNSSKYKIQLLGVKSRVLVSDLAYFNIYKMD
ncbi:hypothetical protein [Algoriphagus sediminis]|uniref:Uncharacterized protein n=1 Tax=Algoriphagus sediminis TaxID=3057113 RepID=A0ABT7YDN8_9BACT|nr:hypothetical protein [Algoriphagus sediminis]MDN3204581.1 hypothetical protein [Algoriphagus sediminis]